MKRDRLEEFMQENRVHFGNEEPRLGHFGRFEEKLSQQKRPKKTIRRQLFFGIASAACVLCLLTFGLGRIMQSTNSENPTSVINASAGFSDFENFERASDEKIESQLGDLRLHYNRHTSDYISEAMAYYKGMEGEFAELKQAYSVTGNRKIAEALSQNMTARECFLDQLLLNLDQKQTNNLYHASFEGNTNHMVAASESCGFFKASGVPAFSRENVSGELRSKR